MFLNCLFLQNFRNYSEREFSFGKGTTVIVGPNASGKTNLLESIFLLSNGTSFRGDSENDLLMFGKDVGRVRGDLMSCQLEVVITSGEINGKKVPTKKYLVNKVSKRRVDFIGHLFCVQFLPLDLDIIVGAPSLRRKFLNDVLETVDIDYRYALLEYTKGLRQRNALLEKAKTTGVRNEKQFEYWDHILIQKGAVLTSKREELIEFINKGEKDVFDFIVLYDKSIIDKERLAKYQNAELATGATLVGPHRDDFIIQMFNDTRQTTHDLKLFGSRGQQRLAILQLKLLQLLYIEEKLKERPTLLLDDIFSELDSEHIKLVLEMTGLRQTIITTTHKEFVTDSFLKKANVIELGE